MIKLLHRQYLQHTLNLELNTRLTMIFGESGTGKTVIFKYLQDKSYIDTSIRCFNAFLVNELSKIGVKLIDVIKSISNSTIVIDNADVILDDELRSEIAELINSNGTLSLDYVYRDVNRKY